MSCKCKQTTHEKVSYMNTLWGNPKGSPSNFNEAQVVQQIKGVREEVGDEFDEAFENNDIVGMLDAAADAIVYAEGLFHVMGVDSDKVMDIVIASNMSKMCKTLKEADDTQKWYKETYDLDTYVEQADDQVWMVRARNDHISPCGKEFFSDKFLKNIKWCPPESNILKLISE